MASVSHDRERRQRRRKIIAVSIAVFFVIWFLSPWLYMSGLRVETVRAYKADTPGVAMPLQITAPEWIKVTFTTSQDLRTYRNKWRLPFIQAGLVACSGTDAGTNDEVASQDGGIFPDRKRIRALGHTTEGKAERYRYEAAFDNLLSVDDGTPQRKSVPALTVPGGLCFRLHGATIASGSVRSATVPLVIGKR